MTGSLVIAPRFCGPPDSGNGGYVCGLIAGYLDGPAEVTLRRPPPLETPLAVECDDHGSARVLDGQTLIAEATRSPGGPVPQLPDPVLGPAGQLRRRKISAADTPGTASLSHLLCVRTRPQPR